MMENRTIRINGEETEVPLGAVAWKFNDPIEDARWIYSEDEARDIAGDDPGLIVWVDGRSDDDDA